MDPHCRGMWLRVLRRGLSNTEKTTQAHIETTEAMPRTPLQTPAHGVLVKLQI